MTAGLFKVLPRLHTRNAYRTINDIRVDPTIIIELTAYGAANVAIADPIFATALRTLSTED